MATDAQAAAEPPAPLRIQLLVGFQIWVGDRVIAPSTWRRRKAASLVKLLALAPQHRRHREQLLETLWPHLGPAAAANQLHHNL